MSITKEAQMKLARLLCSCTTLVGGLVASEKHRPFFGNLRSLTPYPPPQLIHTTAKKIEGKSDTIRRAIFVVDGLIRKKMQTSFCLAYSRGNKASYLPRVTWCFKHRERDGLRPNTTMPG